MFKYIKKFYKYNDTIFYNIENVIKNIIYEIDVHLYNNYINKETYTLIKDFIL